jgi:hypothetical protein
LLRHAEEAHPGGSVRFSRPEERAAKGARRYRGRRRP